MVSNLVITLHYCLVEMWVRASRSLPHANQDTNGAIEAYHGVLEKHFLGAFKGLVGRRIDWLLDTLTESCMPYCGYMQMRKDAGFVKNCSIEELVESCFETALEIPNDNVSFDDHQLGVVKVRSMSQEDIVYSVYGATTEWACCTCKSAELGNICKHQCKVMMLIHNSKPLMK